MLASLIVLSKEEIGQNEAIIKLLGRAQSWWIWKVRGSVSDMEKWLEKVIQN